MLQTTKVHKCKWRKVKMNAKHKAEHTQKQTHKPVLQANWEKKAAEKGAL